MKKNVSYPRMGSQMSRVLARLLNGEVLDHLGTEINTGSYRLAVTINYLGTKHEWVINREEVKLQAPDPIGRDATYMRYWLSDDEIKRAGREGQEYADEVLRWETTKIQERETAATVARTESEEEVGKNS